MVLKGVIKKKTIRSCFLPLVIIAVLTGFTSCDFADVQEDNTDIFTLDRVVEVRIVMAEEDWEFTKNNARDEQYVKADLWYGDELVPDVAVRPKGNSSLMSTVNSGSIKFGLKVDLNFFNTARNLYGVKKLNFNNGFSDPTFIREVLAYDLFEQMGVPTPRTAFVDLWVNDTHLGLYTMVEQIDTTFLSRYFSNPNGNLYKPDQPGGSLDWTLADVETQEATSISSGDVSSPDVNIGGGNFDDIMQSLGLDDSVEEEPSKPAPQVGLGGRPGGGFQIPDNLAVPGGAGAIPGAPGLGGTGLVESMALKTNENKPDHSALYRFLEILNNEPDSTFREEIEKVLDVDQVLRFLAVSATVVHLDNYTGQFGHNYYLYEVDGKFTILPWDLNMAFGAFNSGLDREGILGFLIDEPTSVPVAQRPLVARLLAVPEYLEAYHGYLEELINGPFSPEVMEEKVDRLADMVRPYVDADTLKFFSMQDFELFIEEGRTGANQGNQSVRAMQLNIGLKIFVRERCESIRQQLAGEIPSTNNGQGNGTGMFGGFGGFRPPGNAP